MHKGFGAVELSAKEVSLLLKLGMENNRKLVKKPA